MSAPPARAHRARRGPIPCPRGGWCSTTSPGPGVSAPNLDHIAIGPGGVFVVDAKNWTGRIEVRDQVLVQNGRRRESAVSSVTAAAIAVQEIVSPSPCAGVLCFVRGEPLAASSWNVTVCSTTTLVTTLTTRPPVLGPDDVRRCAEAVRVGTATRPVKPALHRPATRDAHRRSAGGRSWL